MATTFLSDVQLEDMVDHSLGHGSDGAGTVPDEGRPGAVTDSDQRPPRPPETSSGTCPLPKTAFFNTLLDRMDMGEVAAATATSPARPYVRDLFAFSGTNTRDSFQVGFNVRVSTFRDATICAVSGRDQGGCHA